MTRKEVIGELRELKYMFQRRYDKYPSCLEEAIDYIYRTPQWIPVSEDLPKNEKYVLVTTTSGDVTEAKYWQKEGLWVKDLVIMNVTAWMPEPKPYKK